MKTGTRWPWLIIALMVGFALLSAWSFQRAAKEASAVTDHDYYSHGLRYNQTLLERQAAASLGWRADTTLDGQTVTIQLRNRDRQAVSGASGTLTLHSGGTLPSRELALREVAAGSYQTELPVGLHGEFSADITFQRDNAKLNQRLLFAIR